MMRAFRIVSHSGIMEEKKNSVKDTIDFSTTVLSISGLRMNDATQDAKQHLRTIVPDRSGRAGRSLTPSLQKKSRGISVLSVRMYCVVKRRTVQTDTTRSFIARFLDWPAYRYWQANRRIHSSKVVGLRTMRVPLCMKRCGFL